MHLGYTKFKVDTDQHQVSLISGKLIPVDVKKLSPEARTLSLIEHQRQAFPELSLHVTNMTESAMRLYNQESTIGNILTDIMRESSGSDIAMLNSGSIRADLNKGEVTREHVINVYPFVDKVNIVKLSGKQLKELVEYSCTQPYGISQFSGLELVYDSSKPPMQRTEKMLVHGQPIVDDQSYTVSTTAFVAIGGDGYTVFTKGKTNELDILLIDMFVEGLNKQREFSLPKLGRQVDMAN